MNEKMKKFIPLFVIMGLALVGSLIYVVTNRLGMATVNLSEGYVPAGF